VTDSDLKAEFAVQSEMLDDKIQSEFKVERDEYTYAMTFHKLNKDPEVIRLLKETDQNISSELKERIDKKLTTNPQECSRGQSD
jgi:hypothetical protein